METGVVGGTRKGALAAYGNHVAQFGPINMQKKQQHVSKTKASAPFLLGTSKTASKNGGEAPDSQQITGWGMAVPQIVSSSSFCDTQCEPGAWRKESWLGLACHLRMYCMVINCPCVITAPILPASRK